MSTVLSTPTLAVLSSTVAAAEAANRASLTPQDRLALSRENLRRALQVDAGPQCRGTRRDAKLGTAGAAIDRFKAIPGASMLADALLGWWAKQPLRLASAMVFDAATAVVRPVARRSPLGLVAAAFLVGGVIALGRPWRWIFGSTLFTGLSSQLARSAVTHVTMETWLEMLVSLLRQHGAATRAPDRPASSKAPRDLD